MRESSQLVVWALAGLVLAGPVAADSVPSAAEIVAAADRSRNGWESFVVEMEITNYREEEEQEISRYSVYVKGTDHTLVKFENPRDRGKSLLMLEEAMWLYLPSASRPIRVTPLQRLSGNASNGDIAQTSYAANYEATLVGEEEVDGVVAYAVDLTAKRKAATYRQIRLWVAKETQLPLKAEFKLSSGKVSKVALFDRFEKVDGRMLLRQQVIFDLLRNGQKTVVDFTAYLPQDIPDKVFNQNYLRQL